LHSPDVGVLYGAFIRQPGRQPCPRPRYDRIVGIALRSCHALRFGATGGGEAPKVLTTAAIGREDHITAIRRPRETIDPIVARGQTVRFLAAGTGGVEVGAGTGDPSGKGDLFSVGRKREAEVAYAVPGRRRQLFSVAGGDRNQKDTEGLPGGPTIGDGQGF